MTQALDITGRRFNRVVAIKRIGTRNSRALWEWQCDCGKTGESTISILTTGQRMSCGCQRSVNSHLKTHGLSKLPEYKIWKGMRKRCLNPNDSGYHKYGGRGIRICPTWDSFETFLRDMGSRPAPKMDLGRIDNNGPYAPQNCRWETRQQNANNTRRNVLYQYRGQSKTISEWCSVTGASYHVVFDRISRLGWTFNEALIIPKGERRER